MGDYTARRIDEMEGLYGGAMRRVRASLGVESFGIQILDLPPDFHGYPEHDHAEQGQEEVYFALRGAGEVEVEGERVTIDSETVVRVGPQARRKVHSGPHGLRLLALGGVPGAVYEAPEWSGLGGPEPRPA